MTDPDDFNDKTQDDLATFLLTDSVPEGEPPLILECEGMRTAYELAKEDPRVSAFALMQAMRTDPSLADLDGDRLATMAVTLRMRARAGR